MDLKSLIDQAKLDCVNPDILEKLTAETDGLEPTELVHFGKDMTTEEVLQALDARGLAPARIEHLVQYVIKNPDYKELIVALGSSCVLSYGYRYSPYLHVGGRGRVLGLSWLFFDLGWDGLCRFLAFRKSSTSEPKPLAEPRTLGPWHYCPNCGFELKSN